MSLLMLVDGNSLTYRAFFALPTDMATASGQVTNAVYGFTSMLINLVRDQKPDGIVVAFDRPEPTFRHERLPEYKANRTAAPDILRQQMGLVREVVETLAIPIVDYPGFEADDVIATLATMARDRGDDALIVTGDRDSYQLVEDPHIRVLYNRRGVSDYALYDEAGIEERTGVPPRLYVPYAALRGDSSDNLPGVPGVGEKTAAKLIVTYGGLDGIFGDLGALTPKLRESLAANEGSVRTNAELMVLVRDLPLTVDLDQLRLGTFDPEAVRKLFDFLEFRSLHDRLNEALASLGADAEMLAPEQGSVLEAEMVIPETPAALAGVLATWPRDRRPLALAVNSTGPVEGVAIVADAQLGDVVWLPRDWLDDPSVAANLAALVAPGGVPVVTYGAKEVMRVLRPLGIDIRSLSMDVRIAAYLLDPAESRYELGELLARYTDHSLPDAAGTPDGQLDLDGGVVSVALDAGRRALAVSALAAPLRAALDAQGLSRLHDEIEVPLVRVLAKMEEVGIAVDVAELRRLRDELESETERLRLAVIADAGEEFNVNSTKQLREILYEKLKLAPQKKIKTGFSTDHATLERLRGEHPIIDHLLEYREVEKLRSTYGEGLLSEVGRGDRIRATFNQTVARTGRLSSDAPNLHNIPVRTAAGRTFRKAFVAPPGCELLVADYNQIELRCIAHLAEDPGLITAFEAGDDIHNAVAGRVWGVAPTEVASEQRAKAKMVSYGLAYGMEAYGLGQRLGIPTDEAGAILDAYFEAFPAVREYMERTVAEARQRGYTETLFGRRRQIPELSASNFRVRQAGERQAMNAAIQGLAADIFKVALVRLDAALEDRGSRSRVVLQVHDEIILEVPPEEHDEMVRLVLEVMEGAFGLRVPLAVNLAFGPTWADAK